MKFASILISVICFLAVAPGRGTEMKFSRPTLKAVVLEREPTWHREIFSDDYYQFTAPNYPSDENEPAFFVHDKLKDRWLKITELSTENARLGKSLLSPPGWDFTSLAGDDYAHLPIRTTGQVIDSVIFPDRMRFDSNTGIYEMNFNSQRNMPINLSTFWVRKSDLDGISRSIDATRQIVGPERREQLNFGFRIGDFLFAPPRQFNRWAA
ncbi:MAG: hypothetical protein ABI698_01360 [bacterium]